MSNLIRYIIQEDPEKEMKNNELDYTKYSTSWAPEQKQSQEDKYKGYKFSSKNLLENSFNSLTANKSSQSKDEGSFMGGISNIFNNIKSDAKSSSNTSLPQSIAKTTAEESTKIGTVLSPKPIGNDNASYKITQNNKPNIANDAKANNIDYSLYGKDFDKKDIDEMLNDKRFNDIMNSRVKINEGEYINHPNDRGGETKFGISKRWYPNEDIKNLTRERADMILFRDYWKNTNIYQLPDELADIVLDDSIVQGQPTAIKNLQRALGIVDDGIIGSNTLNSIKNTDYKTLKEKFIENVKKVEEQYLNNDPSQRVFEKGHKNRFDKY